MRIRLLMPTLLALAFFVAAGNVFGQFNGSVWYRITARHSGKCLAVEQSAQRDGAFVIQSDCIESDSQKWKVVWTENEYYRIIAKHSLKVLDVYGGTVSQGDGVRVVQWSDHVGDNQQWKITCGNDGYCELEAKHSGKVLDINGGPQAIGNGAFAQQWGSWHGDNQKFMFTVSLLDLDGRTQATRTVCPAEADQARLGVNLLTTDTGLWPRTSFRVGETVLLTTENNSSTSIYVQQGLNAARLIREEGLQVERMIRGYWVPVFPSGMTGPDQVISNNSSTFTAGPLTQSTELPTTRSSSRRWTVPALVGPGIYRLVLDYYRRPNRQGLRVTACSQIFFVR